MYAIHIVEGRSGIQPCPLALSHTIMVLLPKDGACVAQSQALGCWE